MYYTDLHTWSGLLLWDSQSVQKVFLFLCFSCCQHCPALILLQKSKLIIKQIAKGKQTCIKTNRVWALNRHKSCIDRFLTWHKAWSTLQLILSQKCLLNQEKTVRLTSKAINHSGFCVLFRSSLIRNDSTIIDLCETLPILAKQAVSFRIVIENINRPSPSTHFHLPAGHRLNSTANPSPFCTSVGDFAWQLA